MPGAPAPRFSNMTQPDAQSPAAYPPPAALLHAMAASAALGSRVRHTDTTVLRRMASERASSNAPTIVLAALPARVVAMNQENDGTAAAIRIAPIVMATSSSTSVKPRDGIDTSPPLLPVSKLIQKGQTKPACTAQRNLFRDERAAFVGDVSGSAPNS